MCALIYGRIQSEIIPSDIVEGIPTQGTDRRDKGVVFIEVCGSDVGG